MVVLALCRQFADHLRHRCCPWVRPAQIECARFVMTSLTRQQGVSVITAEQRPDGYSAHLYAFIAHALSRSPDFGEPSQLFITRAAKVHFCDGQRCPLAMPSFAQERLR